jgi:molybdate transport system regulatory protein
MKLSARNQLDGTVATVTPGAVMSTITIQLPGGQQVVAAITKESADGLGLTKGDAVKVVIKATDVMVAKD